MSKDAAAGRQELTKAGLLRIVEKTGSKHYTPPADLNRAELWADIRDVAGLREAYDAPSPFDSERRELLHLAAEKARSLRDFVVKNDLYQELSVADFGGTADYCGAFGRAIDGLEAARRVQVPSFRVDIKSVRLGPSMPPGTGLRFVHMERGNSSFEWLVGTYLPTVFEKHFKRRPGSSRDGPYIRFAKRVLIELNITQSDGTPYSPSTIARALTLSRSGNKRRKPK